MSKKNKVTESMYEWIPDEWKPEGVPQEDAINFFLLASKQKPKRAISKWFLLRLLLKIPDGPITCEQKDEIKEILSNIRPKIFRRYGEHLTCVDKPIGLYRMTTGPNDQTEIILTKNLKKISSHSVTLQRNRNNIVNHQNAKSLTKKNKTFLTKVVDPAIIDLTQSRLPDLLLSTPDEILVEGYSKPSKRIKGKTKK